MGDYTIIETTHRRRVIVARHHGEFALRLSVEPVEGVRGPYGTRPFDAYLSRDEADAIMQALAPERPPTASFIKNNFTLSEEQNTEICAWLAKMANFPVKQYIILVRGDGNQGAYFARGLAPIDGIHVLSVIRADQDGRIKGAHQNV